MAKVTGPPNDKKRVERTRKASKCQWCGTKVELKDQFTVVNDLEAGTVIKKKNAARKGAEGMSHWCGDCAEKRVKMSQRWLDRRAGKTATAKSGKTKVVAKGKTKAGAKAKAKVKATKEEAKRSRSAKPKRTTKGAGRPKRTTKRSSTSAGKDAAKDKKTAATADPF